MPSYTGSGGVSTPTNQSTGPFFDFSGTVYGPLLDPNASSTPSDYTQASDGQTLQPSSSTISNTIYYTPAGFSGTLVGGAGNPLFVGLEDNTNVTLTNTPSGSPASPQATKVAGLNARFDVIASAGQNTVSLNKGRSEFHSTIGNDSVTSGGGRDTISGGTGSDTIKAGGHSLIQAGSGAGDSIRGGSTNSSHDTIFAGSGNDVVVVSRGDNLISGFAGNAYLQAGLGHDTVGAGTGKSTIYGGGTTDIEAGKGSHSSIFAQGSDSVYAGGRNTINATSGAQIYESNGRDTIFGSADGSGNKTTVHLAAGTQTKTSGDTTTITFSNGNVVQATNVTIKFDYDPTKHSS